MAYLGNHPGVASQRVVTTFTATAGQTTFTPQSGYTLGYLDVYHNGVRQVNGDDYTASNGVSFVLAEGAAVGDVIEAVAYIPRGLSDGYLKAEADARYQLKATGTPNGSKFLRDDNTWQTADVGYTINGAAAVQIYFDEPPVASQHSGNASDWRTMFTWSASRGGSVRVKFTAYITSGTHYFAYRLLRNGVNVLSSGGYNSGLDTGEISAVHSYRRFSRDITVNAGDNISLQMISANSSEVPVSGVGQTLYAKEFRVFTDRYSAELQGPSYFKIPRTQSGAGVNYDSFGGPGSDSDITFTGFDYKLLGCFNFRGGSRYLDIMTNIASDNIMFQFLSHGYLYNHGNMFAIRGGYTYLGGIINHMSNSLTGSNAIINTYRSGGLLCLKLDKQSSDYTEGEVAVYFHSHNKTVQSACHAIRYAQNNSSGNFF